LAITYPSNNFPTFFEIKMRVRFILISPEDYRATNVRVNAAKSEVPRVSSDRRKRETDRRERRNRRRTIKKKRRKWRRRKRRRRR